MGSPKIEHMSAEMQYNAPKGSAVQIAAIVLTYNEQKHIAGCLDTISWADERIVFDSLSTDLTREVARDAGAVVIENPFENFAQQRNAALHSTSADWVFFIDADERCTHALSLEIRMVVHEVEHPVWAVPRDNYLFGRLTRGAGWFPDYQARLFRVGYASFDPSREVHEVATFDGTMGYLQSTLTHYNYETVSQFHSKQRRYTELDAGMLYKQGVHPKLRNYILQPLREFRRRYIQLKGYKDGLHGLRLSLLLAYYNFAMYYRLARMWQSHQMR